MLNAKLYNALLKVYKQVRVGNKGLPARVMIPPDLPPLGESTVYLPVRNTKGGEQYQIDCPFCGDRKKRLNISYLFGARIQLNSITYQASDSLAVCFNENCLATGDRMSALRNSILPLVPVQSNLVVELGDCSISTDKPELANQVAFPPGYRDILDGPPQHMLDYLAGERGLDLQELSANRVGYAKIYFYKDPALIIPVYQYGHYWFYQARQILPPGSPPEFFPDGNEKPKYYIPSGATKSWALYNLDRAKMGKKIVVVEGVTDVWKVGNEGVAKFGRTISLAQKAALGSCCAGAEIILLPDMNDPKAIESAEEDQILLQTEGIYKNVRIVHLAPDTDPGMYSRKELWERIRN